jgi:hypothetical protein
VQAVQVDDAASQTGVTPPQADASAPVHCTQLPEPASQIGVSGETTLQSIAEQATQLPWAPQYGAPGSLQAGSRGSFGSQSSGVPVSEVPVESPLVSVWAPVSLVPSVVVTGGVVSEVVTESSGTHCCDAHSSPGSQLSSSAQAHPANPGVQPPVSLPSLVPVSVFCPSTG